MEIIQQPLGDAGPLNRSFPPRVTLHTTEGAHYPGTSIYHGTHPTFTCDFKRRKTYQHCGLDRCAEALMHPAGVVETNRANNVQIELVGFSSQVREWSDDDYRYIHRLLLHIHRHGHHFRWHTAFPWGQARFSQAHWARFNGICGHRHVPGNDHTDPGNIKTRKLKKGKKR
jgi:hypothetical protein